MGGTGICAQWQDSSSLAAFGRAAISLGVVSNG